MEDLSLETAVALELREIAGAADALGARLLTLHASLPVSPREDVMLLGEAEPDFSCEMRAAIECGLNDHLQPLIETLRAAADKGGPVSLCPLPGSR